MLGKKQKKQPEEGVKLDVVTIPNDFYGGAEPTVKFKEVEDVVELHKKKELTDSEKAALDRNMATGGANNMHPANFLTSKKFVFLGGLVLFLLIAGGASAYYFLFQKPNNISSNPPIVPITKNEDVTTTPIVEAPTSTEIISTTTEHITQGLPIDFPSTLVGLASDYDNDNVSDLSEGFFNTDPTNSDTDGDKYPDGHELYYLYNPAGFEPMRLIDSGLVKEYKNPVYNYKLYIPNDWVVGEADNEYKEVLFSSISGEYIMVRVFNFEPNETFSDWFFKNAPNEKISYLVDFTTAFKLSGKKRNDGLVYYFMDEKNMYAITYHPTEEGVVNYKIVMDVLARSFRLGDVSGQTTVSEEAPGFVTTTPPANLNTENNTTNNESSNILNTGENNPEISTTTDIEILIEEPGLII